MELAHRWLIFVLDGSLRDPTSFLTLTRFQGLRRGAGHPPPPYQTPSAFSAWGPRGNVRVKDHASFLQSLSNVSRPLLLPPFCPLFMFWGVARGGSRGGREGVQDVQAHGSFGIWASLVVQRPTATVVWGWGWAEPLDLSH